MSVQKRPTLIREALDGTGRYQHRSMMERQRQNRDRYTIPGVLCERRGHKLIDHRTMTGVVIFNSRSLTVGSS